MRPVIAAERLIDDLQRVARESGETTYDAYRFYGAHSVQTVLSRFGSWSAALAAAGLTVNRAGRKRTRGAGFRRIGDA